MNFKDLIRNRQELFIGLITCTLVAGFSLHQWYANTLPFPTSVEFSPLSVSFSVCLFIAYATGFYFIRSTKTPKLKQIGFILSGCSLMVLLFMFNNGLILILAIIFVSNSSEYIPIKHSIIIGFIIPFTYFPLTMEQNIWMNASLFTAFNLFAIFVTNRFKSEKRAKEHAAHLVRELKATQQLLSTTSKRDERLKIARDLHDTLGHHLTALSLQLEIANQLCNEDVAPHITRAQNISRLLLSDVREAVSELRYEKQINLIGALTQLLADLEAVEIEFTHSPQFNTHQARIAETIFRVIQESITNVLKHSNASRCIIKLSRNDDIIFISIRDNGPLNIPYTLGNGLKGMRERIEKMDGILHIEQDKAGFYLSIEIPDPEIYL